MIAGGLTEAKEATPEIQEIADAFKKQLEEIAGKNYTIFKALKYKTQVVAGVNYYISVQTGTDDIVFLKIFKALPPSQQLSLTSYQTGKKAEDEIGGF